METWQDNSKMVLSKLERLDTKFDILEEKINAINISLAVHEVKIGRSSAFYGALSGFLVAILTGVIINYVSAQQEAVTPKIIYKQDTPVAKIETKE